MARRNGRYSPVRYKRRQQRADFMNVMLKDLAYAMESRFKEADVEDMHIVDIVGGNEYECIYCRTKVKTRNIDELVPVTAGGRLNIWNRVPCCGSCNSSKGDATGAQFEAWLVTRGHRGNHDPARAISCERAIAIADYVRANQRALRFTAEDKAAFDRGERALAAMWHNFQSSCERAVVDCVDSCSKGSTVHVDSGHRQWTSVDVDRGCRPN